MNQLKTTTKIRQRTIHISHGNKETLNDVAIVVAVGLPFALVPPKGLAARRQEEQQEPVALAHEIAVAKLREAARAQGPGPPPRAEAQEAPPAQAPLLQLGRLLHVGLRRREGGLLQQSLWPDADRGRAARRDRETEVSELGEVTLSQLTLEL